MEGFYNTFTDLAVEDVYKDASNQTQSIYRNVGKITTYGAEFLVKFKNETDQGLFGWASYTYNRSRYVTHQSELYYTNGFYGRTWINSPYDMPHVVKIVAGYTFGKHTLSSKATYNSSAPYTPITGSYEDTNYKGRMVPLYGKPYSSRA